MMAYTSSCGDANQIDRFMHNARSPPMLTHAESHTQANVHTALAQ
jgi:hypothetical protein